MSRHGCLSYANDRKIRQVGNKKYPRPSPLWNGRAYKAARPLSPGKARDMDGVVALGLHRDAPGTDQLVCKPVILPLIAGPGPGTANPMP
jgi:hypothetical protein